MDSSTFPLIRVKKIARRASRAGSAELGLFEPLCWSRLAWPLRFEDSPGFLCVPLPACLRQTEIQHLVTEIQHLVTETQHLVTEIQHLVTEIQHLVTEI